MDRLQHLEERSTGKNLLIDPTASPESARKSLAQGPRFVDTGACLCALRELTDGSVAWRCLGDKSQDIYDGDSGEWYKPKDKGTSVTIADLPIDSSSSKADPSQTFLASADGFSKEPSDAVRKGLVTPFDFACTGRKDELLSSHYYKALRQQAAGQTPTAAATCLTGSLPQTIQNATSWQKIGCYEGFDCSTNSINALPQYCTPVQPCLHARLGGQTCGLIRMGQFEPVVCPAGSSCDGHTIKPCKGGFYCPKGTKKPIKCNIGSWCPKGSAREQTLVPIIFLILIDISIVSALIYFWIKKRREQRRAKGDVKPSAFSKALAMTRMPQRSNTGGYAQIEEQTYDVPLEARISFAPKHTQTGFLGEFDSFDPYAIVYDTKGPNVIEGNADLNEFVGSMSKCIEGTSTFGLEFEFKDLCFAPKKLSKPILSNITGKISRGSLVGVMGGSGAGKSSFVKILMSKQEKDVSGTIRVNGVKAKLSDYKKVIGYVPQDDIVLPELTVRENILHSARVRLPSTWSEAEISHHVDVVIECLQLTHVKDSLVGSPAKPVVSGGQRKRVSIGIELAAAPQTLLLDEPTSGLDSAGAGHIMTILTALARLGITIVTIIHQPREEIFHAIDDLILLADGRLIYAGKERDVQTYFEGAGFRFPDHCNPADCIIDIITGSGRALKKSGDVSKKALIEHWDSMSSNKASEEQKVDIHRPEEGANLQRTIRKRGAYFHKQLMYCVMRSVLQQYRLMTSFWFEVGLSTLAGLLIGLALNANSGELFHGLYHDDYVMLSSSLDYLTLSIAALLVAIGLGLAAAAPGVKVFSDEKLIYRREAGSGHNKFAYYLGKVVSTFPRMFFGCFHFTTFFILLATPLIPWHKAFILNLTYYYSIYGLSSVVSMITRANDASLLATMAALICGILSGFAPSLKQVSKWSMLWLWRSSPASWLSEAYYSENTLPLAYLYQIEDATTQIGFIIDRFGKDLLMVFAIGTIYRVVAFFLLILVKRSSQR